MWWHQIFVIKCCDMRCCVSVITNHVPMKEYILNLSWWCDLLTFQQGIHAEWRECDQCDENTTCAPQRTYGPRIQCYKSVLPIVTLFSQTKDAQESAKARGGNPFPQYNLLQRQKLYNHQHGRNRGSQQGMKHDMCHSTPALGTISTGSGRAGREGGKPCGV